MRLAVLMPAVAVAFAPPMAMKEEALDTQWRMGRTSKTLVDLGDSPMDMRILPHGRHMLRVAGQRGDWWVSLPSKAMLTGTMWRDRSDVVFLSRDGDAIYRAAFDRTTGYTLRDVLEPQPILQTDRVPLFGLSTGIIGRVLLGLCSESILVQDTRQARAADRTWLYTGTMGGACMCGSLCGEAAFLGTVDGDVLMVDLGTLTMRRLNATRAPPADTVRSIAAMRGAAPGRYHVAVGRESGAVDVYETTGPEPIVRDRFLFRRSTHESAVHSLAIDGIKLVTSDAAGNIVVGDSTQASVWYKTQLSSHARVLMDERFLVASFGRYLEIWDFEPRKKKEKVLLPWRRPLC